MQKRAIPQNGFGPSAKPVLLTLSFFVKTRLQTATLGYSPCAKVNNILSQLLFSSLNALQYFNNNIVIAPGMPATPTHTAGRTGTGTGTIPMTFCELCALPSSDPINGNNSLPLSEFMITLGCDHTTVCDKMFSVDGHGICWFLPASGRANGTLPFVACTHSIPWLSW